MPGKVLLLVDSDELRARYAGQLRWSGFEPVALTTWQGLANIPDGVVAACMLTNRSPRDEAICASLLAAAVPVVLLDPNIRHPREHLPFDVELPLGGDPRQVIAAIRHLTPSH